MAFEDEDYMDTIDMDGFYEDISRLKRCLEERNMIIDTLQTQLDEKEKSLKKLECEIVGLRKEIEKTKALNLKFFKGSETLDEIINVQRSPLNKTGLRYNGETSQASTSKSYLDAARRSEQKPSRNHQVKRAKLQTIRIQYENLKMYNDESVANYFLHVDEIVNCMKNLGEEIKEAVVVEKVLRSLSSRFESKVSAIEEKENLQNLKMSQLHGILTAYEMRKGGPSDRRVTAFKVSGKGEYYESGHVSEEEEESNFVRNLQRGTGRFKGKLPFKEE
eukprot:PITA_02679